MWKVPIGVDRKIKDVIAKARMEVVGSGDEGEGGALREGSR